MTCVRGRVWIVLLGMAAGGGAVAQGPGGSAAVTPAANSSVAPVTSIGEALRSLASRAGVVFVGQVQSIVPKDGVVEITFQVQQAVLGVVGGSYVMREWAGRWTGGQQHFQVGQQAMFFLHAPSAAGMSSAVDGMMGVVPVVPVGANGAALLDVRWLATRVRRAMGAPLGGTAGAAGISQGGIALADGVAVARAWQTDLRAEPKSVRLPEGLVPQPQAEEPALPPGLRAGQNLGAVSAKEADDVPR